jgi:hypothetical protein
VPLVRGSTTGNPLSSSFVAGVLLDATIVKGVTPLVAQRAFQCRLVTLGCRAHRTVAAAAQAVTARVFLVLMAPWAGTGRVVLSPLVCSGGSVSAADVHEPDVEEPSVEELCVEQPSQLL